MNKGIPAIFNFAGYKIQSFSFRDTPAEFEKFPMQIEFSPGGIYDSANGTMEMEMGINIRRMNAEVSVHDLIMIEVSALFIFKTPTALADLPTYFYRNSLAIIFPYLRAFVTTMTAIANIKPLILPLMNLSGIEEDFRNNITSAKSPVKKSAAKKNTVLPALKPVKKVAKKTTR